MGYESAIRAAGADVLNYHSVGSCQGKWGMIVNFKGKTGLVTGAFGSCSHCDAFQSEFGYVDEEERDPKYQERLARFGGMYLSTIWDKWDAENRLKSIAYDEDYEEWDEGEMRELLLWALPQL
jgi:hypothetical protein